MRLGKDRRESDRFKKYHLIKCEVNGKGKGLSFIRDISMSGLLFHSKVDMSAGQIVHVSLLAPAESAPIIIGSRVVRSRGLKKTGGFSIGVKFEGLKSSDKDYISRMLSSFKRSGK